MVAAGTAAAAARRRWQGLQLNGVAHADHSTWRRAGRAPGRSQAGPRPLGGPDDVPVGQGAVMTTDAVIVSTARTGLAKSWKGAFNMTYGATLAAHSIAHAVKRAGVD